MRRLVLSIAAALSLLCSEVSASDSDPIRLEAAGLFADIARDVNADPELRVKALYALRYGSFNTPRIALEYFGPAVRSLSEELTIQKWCMQFLSEWHTDLKLAYYCSNLIIENYIGRRITEDSNGFITELTAQDPPEERLTAEDVSAMSMEAYLDWIYHKIAMRLNMTPETFARGAEWLTYLESNYYVEYLLDLERACIPLFISDTVFNLQRSSGLSRKDALARLNELIPLEQLAERPATPLPLSLQTKASLEALALLGPQECKE